MKIFFILLWASPLIGIAQKTDFSGNWSLNTRKTDFKQAPDWIMPVAFEIKQKKDQLVIQTKAYDKGMVQHYYTEYLPFNGSASEVMTWDDNKRNVSLHWNPIDSSITLSIRVIKSDNPSGASYTETWSLGDDGKTLIIDRQASQADGYNIKAVYNKK
jgi:hypothetical protein